MVAKRRLDIAVHDWLYLEPYAKMDARQLGAYLRLCMILADLGNCGLPADDKVLASLSQMGDAWYVDGRKVRDLFYEKAGKLYSGWVDARFAKEENWRQKSAAGGQRSRKAGEQGTLALPDIPPDVDSPFTPADLGRLWNEVSAANDNLLGKVIGVPASSARYKHIRCRLKEHPDRQWWRMCFEAVFASDFLCGRAVKGRSAKHKNWKASFVWLVKSPDPSLNVMEGKYDNEKPKTSPVGAGSFGSL